MDVLCVPCGREDMALGIVALDSPLSPLSRLCTLSLACAHVFRRLIHPSVMCTFVTDTELWDLRDVDRPASDVEAALANRTHLLPAHRTSDGSPADSADVLQDVTLSTASKKRHPLVAGTNGSVATHLQGTFAATYANTGSGRGRGRVLGSALRCRGAACIASSGFAGSKGRGCLECAGCDSGCAYSTHSRVTTRTASLDA